MNISHDSPTSQAFITTFPVTGLGPNRKRAAPPARTLGKTGPGEGGNDKVCFSLAMSPIGDAFRNRLRMFPSLTNCCTIDWFQSWPTDALELVANRFLEDVELDDSIRAE